jgi:uncharacterized protein (TIGR02246 family)
MTKLVLTLTRSIMLTGLAFGLVSQATAQAQSSATDPALQKTLQGISDKYEAAFNSKDAAGIAALYAENGVLIVGVPGDQVHSGRQDLEKFYEGAFKHGVSGLHATVEEVHSSGDVAWARGSFTEMRPAMQGGNGLEQVHGLFGGVYEREGDSYKIVQLTAFLKPMAPAQPAAGSSTPPASENTSK